MLKALKSVNMKRLLDDQAILRQLDNAEAAKKFDDAVLRQLASNKAMVDALKRDAVRKHLLKAGMTEAMLRPSFQNF